MASDSIQVEVAYASPAQQRILTITIPAHCSVMQAINASGILQHFPEIDLNTQKVGIFGLCCMPDKPVVDGDRIEIYRPLLQDPMTARRNRVQK